MARRVLYQYAILHHPKPTKDAMGNDTTAATEIVTPITSALGSSDQEIQIIAARGLPEKFLSCLDDIEILVRPL